MVGVRRKLIWLPRFYISLCVFWGVHGKEDVLRKDKNIGVSWGEASWHLHLDPNNFLSLSCKGVWAPKKKIRTFCTGVIQMTYQGVDRDLRKS